MRYNENRLLESDEILFLIQAPPKGYMEKLRNGLRLQGCVNPIIVWNNFIVDGHKRYRICRELNIPYKTLDLGEKGEAEVMSYICREQLKRDDLTVERRRYLIGRLFHETLKAQKESYLYDSGYGSDAEMPEKRITKTDLATMLASELGLSLMSIRNYADYAERIDSIRSKDTKFASDILNGQIFLSRENIAELARLSEYDTRKLYRYALDNKAHRIDKKTVLAAVSRKRSRNTGIAKTSDNEDNPIPQIRNMPAYDPDAEISSMAYTIPTWKDSLERCFTRTDFKTASKEAVDRLIERISDLKDTIVTIIEAVQEDENHG